MINGSPTNLDTPHGAYRYDAWGNPVGAGNYATGISRQATALITQTLAEQIASRQVLRYAGYTFDSESGLYYLSARSYDPVTRQFVSVDTAKADGEGSAYQYCSGGPISMTDPTGEYAPHPPRPKKIGIHLTWNSASPAYLKQVLKVDAGYARHAGRAVATIMELRDWNFKSGDGYKGLRRFLGWNAQTSQGVGPQVYTTTFHWVTYIGKCAVSHKETRSKAFGGNRFISAEDFGNIHFGYIGHALHLGLGTLEAISLGDARVLTPYDRKSECRGEAMVKWGYQLMPRWGTHFLGKYFTRNK